MARFFDSESYPFVTTLDGTEVFTIYKNELTNTTNLSSIIANLLPQPLDTTDTPEFAKLGIANDTPIYELDVVGDINYTGTLYSNNVPFRESPEPKGWTRLPLNNVPIFEDDWINQVTDVGDGILLGLTGYGILVRSVDGGYSWQETGIIDAFAATYVSMNLAINSNGEVLVIDENGDVWKTHNRGFTWTIVHTLPYTPQYATLATDSSELIVIAGASGLNDSTQNIAYSYDFGETWTDTTFTLDAYSYSSHWIQWWGGTTFALVDSQPTSGWHRSTDGGVTWGSHIVGPAGTFSERMSLTKDEEVILLPRYLLYGQGNLYRSTDQGVTWDAVSHPVDQYAVITGFIIDTDAVIATISATNSHFYISKDRGLTYEKVTLLTLPDYDNWIYIYSIANNTIVVWYQDNTFKDHIACSYDWGTTWKEIPINELANIEYLDALGFTSTGNMIAFCEEYFDPSYFPVNFVYEDEEFFGFNPMVGSGSGGGVPRNVSNLVATGSEGGVFTQPQRTTDIANVDVWVNGIKLVRTAEYTSDGNEITITNPAILANDDIEIITWE